MGTKDENYKELKALGNGSEVEASQPWLRRTFGPMNQGSIRGSVFTLASTAMGAGYLAIPRVLEYTGLLLGMTLIVFCALVMRASLKTVMRCIFKHQIFYYPDVTEKELGRVRLKQKWAVLLEVAIILNGLGVMISYFLIVGLLAPDILNSLNAHGNKILERDLTMVGLAVLVVTPLGLMRKIGALRFKALFNVINMSFVAILVFVEFPLYAENNDFSEIRYVWGDIHIFSGFSLPIFAYLCHQNISKIQSELVRCDEGRMDKVITRAVIIQCSLFCFLAFFAYMSLLNNLPDLIIMRRPPDQVSNDWAMVMARTLLCFTLMIAIPINLIPTRTSILKVVFKKEGDVSVKL
jgi:sodium-coupled neutral amino acid transporter 10